jgi:hypothetical protein
MARYEYKGKFPVKQWFNALLTSYFQKKFEFCNLKLLMPENECEK